MSWLIQGLANQLVGFNAVSSQDGSAITSGVTVQISLGGGTPVAPTNAATHRGGGLWIWVPDTSELVGTSISLIPAGTNLIPCGQTLQVVDHTVYLKNSSAEIYQGAMKGDTGIDGLDPETALVYIAAATFGNRTTTVEPGQTGTEQYVGVDGSTNRIASLIAANGNRTITQQ